VVNRGEQITVTLQALEPCFRQGDRYPCRQRNALIRGAKQHIERHPARQQGFRVESRQFSQSIAVVERARVEEIRG